MKWWVPGGKGTTIRHPCHLGHWSAESGSTQPWNCRVWGAASASSSTTLPPSEASLPWEPNYNPCTVRFLLINRGTVTTLRGVHIRCHNCASTMDAKTPVRWCVFSPHHVVSLKGSLGLPPNALLYSHGLGPGHITDSSPLLVGRDRGRPESFLSYLFLLLSKYRDPFPQANERQTKTTNKAQEVRTSLFLDLPCISYFLALLLTCALGGNC